MWSEISSKPNSHYQSNQSAAYMPNPDFNKKLETLSSYQSSMNLILSELREIHRTIFNLKIFEAQKWHAKLLEDNRFKESGHLIPYGYKIHSKHDEDGILREIFTRIGSGSKTFLELGVESFENNTLGLVLAGWGGTWVDGRLSNVNEIREKLSFLIAKGALTVRHQFVTKENIAVLWESDPLLLDVSFVSIDVDGNDYHLMEACAILKPRVFCVEYNPKFPPPIRWIMEYNPTHCDNNTDYMGASIQSLSDLAESIGYSLVCCGISGINAFFVRKDLLGDHFLKPGDVLFHYQPACFDLYMGLGSRLTPSFGPFSTT